MRKGIKKLVALGMVSIMAMSAVACGKTEKNEGGDNEST
jgi:hypothetical protein